MSIEETNRVLSYAITTAQFKPHLDPAEVMEYMLSVAPIKRDTPTYNEVYYDFLVWWFTKRNRLSANADFMANQIIHIWTILARMCESDSDLVGDVAIEGVKYNYNMLRQVLQGLIHDGLIRIVGK